MFSDLFFSIFSLFSIGGFQHKNQKKLMETVFSETFLDLMALVLYAPAGNPRAAKILIAAEYSGVSVKLVENFQIGVDNRTPEFLAKNPNGRVPVLETPEGPIWESNAIVRYIARLGNKIYGQNAYETALIDQWIEWSRGDLENAAVAWIYPIWGYAPFDAEASKKAQELVKAQLVILNNYLKLKSFLVGERLSLADIVLAATLAGYYSTVFDVTYRKAIPNVNRWFLTVVNQPKFLKIVPQIEIVEKAKQPAAPAPKKEEPKKEAAPKAKVNFFPQIFNDELKLSVIPV